MTPSNLKMRILNFVFYSKEVDIYNDSGEQLVVETMLHHNGDTENGKYTKDGIWLTQSIILKCYGQSACINCNCLTPEKLRELADKLEEAESDALSEWNK